jgi:putative CocE/NonD family hydrolase
MHAYFAGHGYVSVRVDLRGSGDSEGILADEYLPLEQEDGIGVISWLAAQPFCSGSVGMIGISWGGFNGLQIAAHAPPELGAVISICSTDDRYTDDVHYMGGCLLSATMLSWASVMLAFNARPPDPANVGEAWREMWMQRMEHSPPFVEAWMSHQLRDDYWKQGSVCEDYAAIKCPVYVVGGWSDAYTNAVPRFLQHYQGPCRGLIGPWNHTYPEHGLPGPAIGFLQESLRFYDQHLKGIDNGVMEEPKLRLYMPDSVRPNPSLAHWPGRWLAADGWPVGGVETSIYPVRGRGLGGSSGPEMILALRGAESVAASPGMWGGLGGPIDNPADQEADDGLSLSFDTDPLTERLEILGVPIAYLEVASDRSCALLAVRLCDVWPDGSSTLITRGLLNLTHRDGHEHPEDLVPGQRYVVGVRLNVVAYSIPPGHRLRLAVSPTYWPWAWPSPEPVTLELNAGGQSRLELPVLPAGTVIDAEPPEHFGQPEEAASPDHEARGYEDAARQIRRDVASGLVEIVNTGEEFLRLHESGLQHLSVSSNVHSIVEGEPLSALNRYEREITIARGDWRTRVHTVSTLSSTVNEFQVTNVLEGFEGDARVFAKTWRFSVPRNHV